MSFPQYHDPSGVFDFSWIWIPALLLVTAVVMLILEDRKRKRGEDSSGLMLLGLLFGVSGGFSLMLAIVLPSTALQDREEIAATRAYHSEVARYIDSTYSIEISSESAADLVEGKEAAGVDSAGETITLSLLNRTQKEPVLIGTDHNPIPKSDRLEDGSED